MSETTITPGSTITIKITKKPNNEGARKTLVRLLNKDAAAIAEKKRLKRVRKSNQTHSSRGGRWRVWEGRLVTQHSVEGVVGEAGTLVASADVLRDLKKLYGYIEISVA